MAGLLKKDRFFLRLFIGYVSNKGRIEKFIYLYIIFSRTFSLYYGGKKPIDCHPINLAHFYTATLYIRMDKTSWTCSMTGNLHVNYRHADRQTKRLNETAFYKKNNAQMKEKYLVWRKHRFCIYLIWKSECLIGLQKLQDKISFITENFRTLSTELYIKRYISDLNLVSSRDTFVLI